MDERLIAHYNRLKRCSCPPKIRGTENNQNTRPRQTEADDIRTEPIKVTVNWDEGQSPTLQEEETGVNLIKEQRTRTGRIVRPPIDIETLIGGIEGE